MISNSEKHLYLHIDIFPRNHFTGYDFTSFAINIIRNIIRKMRVNNLDCLRTLIVILH